jgi:hypothetical protein
MAQSDSSGAGCLITLLVLVGLPAYLIWDGTSARRLEPAVVSKIDATAKVTTAGWVTFANLENAPQGIGWDAKAIAVKIDNRSDFILRGIDVAAVFKSKIGTGANQVVRGPCLHAGKPDLRILSGATDDQACIVWLSKGASDLMASPDFDGWEWSFTTYGHSQPLKFVMVISEWWDNATSWFRPVNK